MMAEDVTLKAVNDSENRQSLLYGMGDQHLEIAVASKLRQDINVEITLETPKVAFRETIRRNLMLIPNTRNNQEDMDSTDMLR